MKLDILNKEINILVTGGAGFIGGCLIRRLLNNPKLNIYNLDKISYASNVEGIDSCKNFQKHILIKTDLSDYNKVEKAIEFSNPDLIIHLAAESHVDRSIDHPKPFIESNIVGTFNILEACRKHWKNLNISRKKHFKFIHISTDEVFGSLGKNGFFSESSPYQPRSPYSASKAASDHLVKSWFSTFGFPTIVTNCSNNFGPYQFPEKLIPLVILKAMDNLPIPIYGKGDNIRDWLFVEDHIDAILLIIKKGEIGETYCIGGNNERTNLDIVNEICALLDKKLRKDYLHKELIRFVNDRPGHDRRYAINSEFIRKKLGWSPKNDFKQALNKTIDWYLSNKTWCDMISKRGNYEGERIGLN